MDIEIKDYRYPKPKLPAQSLKGRIYGWVDEEGLAPDETKTATVNFRIVYVEP